MGKRQLFTGALAGHPVWPCRPVSMTLPRSVCRRVAAFALFSVLLMPGSALGQMLQRNPHSPPRYRVSGIVPHLVSFHEAFDVRPGDEMYRPPEKRIEIW